MLYHRRSSMEKAAQKSSMEEAAHMQLSSMEQTAHIELSSMEQAPHIQSFLINFDLCINY